MADIVLIIPGDITIIPKVNCIFETEQDYYIIYSDGGAKFRSYPKKDVLRIIMEPEINDSNYILRKEQEARSSLESNSNKGIFEPLRNNDGEQDGS